MKAARVAQLAPPILREERSSVMEEEMTPEEWDHKCKEAISVIQESASDQKAKADELQLSKAFFCAKRSGNVTPAECADCFEKIEPSLRLLFNDNRDKCIAIHGKELKVKKEVKNEKKNIPAKNPTTLKIGSTVKVELEKGQPQVEILISSEMAQDREAALSYAEDAVKNKSLAEIQLCVAAALYLGEGEHAPWVIDEFESPRVAAQVMFGWSDMKVSYRKRLGQAFIKQYGKDNVLQRAEEIGLGRIPQRKLREFLKAPEQFARFLDTGRFTSVGGEEITIDQILKKGVEELPRLFSKFTADKPVEKKALPPAKKDDPFNDFDDPENTRKTLAEKEALIDSSFIALHNRLENDLTAFVNQVKLWPEDAVKIIESSPKIEESYEKVKSLLYALHNTATVATYNPSGTEAISESRDGTTDDLMTLPKGTFKTQKNKK